MDTDLSSTRPYLLRAMHEWMSDNGETPLVVVDARMPGVIVPAEHVADGRIVLNLAWAATRGLTLGNDEITFQARFGGVPHAVTLPLDAVLGIYARESGQGMVFQKDSGAEQIAAGESAGEDQPVNAAETEGDDGRPRPRPGGPNLRVIK
jgi:stringent starvation protein B